MKKLSKIIKPTWEKINYFAVSMMILTDKKYFCDLMTDIGDIATGKNPDKKIRLQCKETNLETLGYRFVKITAEGPIIGRAASVAVAKAAKIVVSSHNMADVDLPLSQINIAAADSETQEFRVNPELVIEFDVDQMFDSYRSALRQIKRGKQFKMQVPVETDSPLLEHRPVSFIANRGDHSSVWKRLRTGIYGYSDDADYTMDGAALARLKRMTDEMPEDIKKEENPVPIYFHSFDISELGVGEMEALIATNSFLYELYSGCVHDGYLNNNNHDFIEREAITNEKDPRGN